MIVFSPQTELRERGKKKHDFLSETVQLFIASSYYIMQHCALAIMYCPHFCLVLAWDVYLGNS